MSLIESCIKLLPAAIRSQIEGRASTGRIISNLSWQSSEYILRLGGGILITAWISRYLLPTNAGILAFAASYSMVLLPIVLLGIDHIVIRELVNNPDRKNELLGTAFTLKLASGFIAWALMLVTFNLTYVGPVTIGMVALTGTALLSQSVDTLNLWFVAKVETRKTAIARKISFLMVSVLRIALILAAADVFYFAASYAVDYALIAIGLGVAYWMSGEHFRHWTFSREQAKMLLATGWPLALAAFFAFTINARIGRLLVWYFHGDHELGIYGVVATLVEVCYVVPVIACNSVAPAILNAKKVDTDLYYSRLQGALTAMALFGLLVAIPTSLLAPWIIQVLYGSAYSAGSSSLAVLIWMIVPVSLAGAQNIWITSENRIYFTLAVSAVSATLFLALGLILIPIYAGLGCAISVVVSHSIAVLFVGFAYAPARRITAMTWKALLLRR
ncbi:MAG: flippase [Planctomycetota bacterium]|nr:flippase [Planctomycetota bacterium]